MKTEIALAAALPTVTHGFDGNCTLPVKACPECMRAWLDRPPPLGSWRDFEAPDATGPLDLAVKAALTTK